MLSWTPPDWIPAAPKQPWLNVSSSGCAAGGPEVAPSPDAPAAPPSEEGASAPPAPAAAAGPPRTQRARVQAALSYAAFGRRPPLLKRKRETPRSSADAGGTVKDASDFEPFEGGDAAPETPPIPAAAPVAQGKRHRNDGSSSPDASTTASTPSNQSVSAAPPSSPEPGATHEGGQWARRGSESARASKPTA